MIENPRLDDNTRKLFETLTSAETENIYRAVHFNYIVEDIKIVLKEEEKELKDSLIAEAAARYAYDGDYDCNLDYWSNIRNLVDEVSKN